jgi:hypothetical protein
MMNQYENEYDKEVCECWEELSDENEYDSVDDVDDNDYDDCDGVNLEYDSRTLLPKYLTRFNGTLGDDDDDDDDGDGMMGFEDDERKSPTQLVPLPGKKQHASEQLWQAEFAKQRQHEREALALREAEARLAVEKEHEQKLQLMQLEEAHIFWNMTYQFEISTGADERDACARAGETMMKFADSLPTESQGARQKRINEDKEKIKAEKERRMQPPLKFPHRRNGGGKGKVFEPPSEEVMAARRALKRRQRKERNRVEEAQRAAQFAAAPPVSKEEEYIKKPKKQEELTEEEIESRREEQKYIWDTVISKLTHQDFPDLVKEPKKSKVKKSKADADWATVGKKSKAIELPKVIKMGAAPYRTPSAPPAPVAPPENAREKAFEKLADAQGEGGKSLTRTKMCLSVTEGVPCRHGDRCRFAHSQEELQVAKCFFGCNCRFVRQTNQGWWMNAGGDKKCTFIHEGESKENYVKRVGIATGSQDSSPKSTPLGTPKPSRSPSPALLPVVSELPKTSVWGKVPKISEEVCSEVSEEGEDKPPTPVPGKEVPKKNRICDSVLKGVACRHGDRCRFSHSPPSTQVEEVPKEVAKEVPKEVVEEVPKEVVEEVPKEVVEEVPKEVVEEVPKEVPKEVVETVLRVPAALAMQAMEIALKSGMKNVRVEIV